MRCRELPEGEGSPMLLTAPRRCRIAGSWCRARRAGLDFFIQSWLSSNQFASGSSRKVPHPTALPLLK